MTTPTPDHDRLPPSPDRDDAFAAIAADLTFTDPPAPKCECRCHLSPIPHGDGRCDQPAACHVACHLWGECEHPDGVDEAAVDPDGNLCAVMCRRCATTARSIAERQIDALIAHTRAGTTPHCPACGRPTVTADDICEIRAMMP